MRALTGLVLIACHGGTTHDHADTDASHPTDGASLRVWLLPPADGPQPGGGSGTFDDGGGFAGVWRGITLPDVPPQDLGTITLGTSQVHLFVPGEHHLEVYGNFDRLPPCPAKPPPDTACDVGTDDAWQAQATFWVASSTPVGAPAQERWFVPDLPPVDLTLQLEVRPGCACDPGVIVDLTAGAPRR